VTEQINPAELASWLVGYEKAWRNTGTAALGELFTPDASYRQGPYLNPVVGLPAIARMWEDTRDGPSEDFRMTSEVVAIDRGTAVVRLEVRYGTPVTQELPRPVDHPLRSGRAVRVL